MEYPEFLLGELKQITSKITRLEQLDEPTANFLHSNIQNWMISPERKLMLTAQDYYKNKNDIVNRKRMMINRHGDFQEAKNLSNTRLPHPFLRKLVNQKVNYLLSKELSIQSDDMKFVEALGTYVTKGFLKMLKNIGKDAVVNGIAWVQVFYDREGQLSFKRIPSEEIVPFWVDSEHTKLEGILRTYTVTEFKADGSTRDVTKVEYHTINGVWYFIKGDKGLEEDPDHGRDGRGHFTLQAPQYDADANIKRDGDGNVLTEDLEATWDKIPFVAFKYNADEISLLQWVKPLIDDYDLNASDVSNTLQDAPNSIKVVKNYDGTDPGEFVHNLSQYRTAFVHADGDVSSLEVPLDVTAIDSHLDRLRKDIYEAGSGVDTQIENLGNASGVALNFRYADLDTDIQDMASEFTFGLEELIWFIQVDMANNGQGDFFETSYDILFNTDHIINESEVIVDARNSLGLISEETIMANHPWVTDFEEERQRLEDERGMKLELMPFGNFGTFTPDGEDEEEDVEQ